MSWLRFPLDFIALVLIVIDVIIVMRWRKKFNRQVHDGDGNLTRQMTQKTMRTITLSTTLFVIAAVLVFLASLLTR